MTELQLCYLKEIYEIEISNDEFNNLSYLKKLFIIELSITENYSYPIILNMLQAIRISNFAFSDIITVLAMAFKIGKFDEIFALVLLTRHNSIAAECKRFLDKYKK